MNILDWLERQSIIATVVKPADTFNTAQKYIRYVEPWMVSPCVGGVVGVGVGYFVCNHSDVYLVLMYLQYALW